VNTIVVQVQEGGAPKAPLAWETMGEIRLRLRIQEEKRQKILKMFFRTSEITSCHSSRSSMQYDYIHAWKDDTLRQLAA
jgi:hypothetical protein